MDYYKYEISSKVADPEILLGVLSHLPFDTFEEHRNTLCAYLPVELLTEEVEDELAYFKGAYSLTITRAMIPHQNWNALWESNFTPIRIDDFVLIRADFHPKETGFQHELIINPKMAFGTGHHDTTFLVIQAMRQYEFRDKKVLDYGCGTGILAILADKLGSSKIHAIDIEWTSFENTKENIKGNKATKIEVNQGSLDKCADSGFDIVLANINRNVIVHSFELLNQKMNAGGILITSGYYEHDIPIVEPEARKQGFYLTEVKRKNNWVCATFVKQ
ncbi:MAG: 50S ribosomal protein L11 methyltransferase [Saprospiraceae bacterium]